MALSISLLMSMAIGVFPPILWSFQHGVSSDFMMGLFFMFADFVFPCVILSIVLASIPIFDSLFRPSYPAAAVREGDRDRVAHWLPDSCVV